MVTEAPAPTAYCATSGTCQGGTQARHISNVTYGDVDNNSGCGNYTDYTNLTSSLPSDGSQDITIFTSAFNPLDGMAAFVDWNEDFDFEDAGESIVLQGNAGLYTGAMSPPAGTSAGAKRLRIGYYSTGEQVYSGCGTHNIGEVEDYTVTVTAPAPNCVINAAPANEAVDVCPITNLSWAADPLGSAVTGFKIYFGTETNPPLVATRTRNQTTYNPGTLMPNTTYFWKAVAYNGTGDAEECAEMSFTVSGLGTEITPNNPSLCIGVDQLLNGGATGEAAGGSTHEWTGTGAANLDDPAIAEPTFNAAAAGTYNLIYTITDGNGCTSSDEITVDVADASPIDVSIAITNGSSPSCEGSEIQFTATPTNGGSMPTYSWRVNGTDVATGDVFSSTAITDGDLVDVVMTSNNECAATPTATSNDLTIQRTAQVTPDVAIDLGMTEYCEGEALTFTPTPTNEGTTPSYEWFLNGSSISTDAVYSAGALATGDIVTCVLTSSDGCVTSSTANSNEFTVAYTAPVDPSVDFALTAGSNPTCFGQTIEFSPTATNGGDAPTYEWFCEWFIC